ncbi:MAG TPA: hypothetical protein VGG05_23175 [Pseudonocardiaceae bacterium]
MDDNHPILCDAADIQSELAYLLLNSTRIDVLGIAPQPLIDAIRRVTSGATNDTAAVLAPITYSTPRSQIVLAHAPDALHGKLIRRWNASLIALRNILSGSPDGPSAGPYASFAISELFLDCLVRLTSNDGGVHMVGLTVLPGPLGREQTVMWQVPTPPSTLLATFDAMLQDRKPLLIREIHCAMLDQSAVLAVPSDGTTSWPGPRITRFLPYGISSHDDNFLMPVAIVAIRATTPRGPIAYLKQRTLLTDHNDFGVLSLLSARVLEEDLAVALNLDLGDKQNDDDAFEKTWIMAGKPNPFTVPLDAFRNAAQRELYSSCGLHIGPDRLAFRGFQVLDHETANEQLCFAIFDCSLRRSGDQDELRDLESWNPTGMVRVDRDRLYATTPEPLPLNRLLRARSTWLTEHVFNRPVDDTGGHS